MAWDLSRSLAFYSAKDRPELMTNFRPSACHSQGKYSSDTQFRNGGFGARRLISQDLTLGSWKTFWTTLPGQHRLVRKMASALLPSKLFGVLLPFFLLARYDCYFPKVR